MTPRSEKIFQVLAGVFKAEGVADWRGLAERAARDFEIAERDEWIYMMRHRMTAAEIGQAKGLTSRRVQQIIRLQLTIRRGKNDPCLKSRFRKMAKMTG